MELISMTILPRSGIANPLSSCSSLQWSWVIRQLCWIEGQSNAGSLTLVMLLENPLKLMVRAQEGSDI
jgi:hypothetical protein